MLRVIDTSDIQVKGKESGVRVLIADSAQVVRSALRLLVQDCRPDAVIVETRSLRGIFELMEQNRIDVAMVDWSLLRQGGYTAIKALHGSKHGAYVIILSGHPISKDEPDAMRADAFVDKGKPPDTLHTILDNALSCDDVRGDDYASAALARTSDSPKGRAATRRQLPESHRLLT